MVILGKAILPSQEEMIKNFQKDIEFVKLYSPSLDKFFRLSP